MKKRDITSSRTPGDTERKYGKRIVESEKELRSQNKNFSSLINKINNVNSQIAQINEICEGFGLSIGEISMQVEENTRLSHSHENKEVLDELTDEDIEKLNNQFTGDYNVLAQNIVANQKIEGIDNYNLILLQISNVNRYIPCFKYGSSYKGINITKDTTIDMEEISIEIQNETVINIVSTNSILKIIGIF